MAKACLFAYAYTHARMQAELSAVQQSLAAAEAAAAAAVATRDTLQRRIDDPTAWKREREGLEAHIAKLKSEVRHSLTFHHAVILA